MYDLLLPWTARRGLRGTRRVVEEDARVVVKGQEEAAGISDRISMYDFERNMVLFVVVGHGYTTIVCLETFLQYPSLRYSAAPSLLHRHRPSIHCAYRSDLHVDFQPMA